MFYAIIGYMKIIRLDNSSDKYVLPLSGEFLQSFAWFDLLKREGEEVEIWGLEEKREVLASALIIKKKLFFSYYYYYLPRGPIGEKKDVLLLLAELKKNKREAVFLRLEPLVEINSGNDFLFQKTLNLQPQQTLFLDLSFNESDLLKAMHQKTRYNIRLAENKGVNIILAGLDKFSDFWRLLETTSSRDGFRLHDRCHYENLLKSEKEIKMYLAYFNGQVIAGGLFSFFSDRVTYLHGASDNSFRNLMAPYLLQWTVIKEAKKNNNYRYYDFYGIDEKKWPGVTRFKIGFGGFSVKYPGTYDLILRKRIYNLYNFLRRLKRALKV